MRFCRYTLLPLVVFHAIIPSTAAAEEPYVALELVKALWIEGTDNLEPSGLTMRAGELYGVCDNHGDTIFKITLGEKTAQMTPYLTFDPAPLNLSARMDMEGITLGPDGGFFVVSETQFRAAYISADGKQVMWVTPSLRAVGQEAGLFAQGGAWFEGLTVLGEPASDPMAQHFLLCAERQPRGFVEADYTVEPPKLRATAQKTSLAPIPLPRVPDYTDLWREGERLYALVRNADAIVPFTWEDGQATEQAVWSYRDIVWREELRFENMLFGQAEGLCMDAENVYVCFDIGNDGHAQDPSDKRPLLLVLKRPVAP